jgi:hypothetical protein
VLGEHFELLDGAEQLDQLCDTSAEEVKSTEDLIWGELKLFTLWHVHESLSGELILFLIGLVEVNAALENWDKFLWWVFIFIPKYIITLWVTSLGLLLLTHGLEVQDIPSASSDHLCGNFDKEASHSLIGIVVSSDSVDHLDTVHQCWKNFLDALWSTIVEWLNESLKGLEIFDIIFGLIESFGYSKLNASPL